MKGIETVEHTARNAARKGIWGALSVALTAALVFPSFPLSAITPAFASEDPDQQGASDITSSESYEGRINVDVALDGSVVDSNGQLMIGESVSTEENALSRLLADNGLGAADTNPVAPYAEALAAGQVRADVNLLGSDVEGIESRVASACSNCLDEADAMSEGIREQEAERDREVEAALAQDDIPTHEEVLAGEQAAAKAEAELSELAPYDTAVMPDDLITRQSFAEDDPTAAASARTTEYSTDVVLKNVYFIGIYDSYAQLKTSSFFLRSLNNNPKGYTILVRAYNMPDMHCPFLSARWSNGIGYLTFRLPLGTDEEERIVEMAFTSGVESDSYVRNVTSLPAVTDATVLAGLAEMPGYDQTRDRAYLNAYRLAPFASLEDIVASGNRIPAGSALATKTVTESWPIHEEDGMKVSLFEQDLPNIARFFVYYSDGTSEMFDVDHVGLSGLAASYVARDSGILYQPDFWVMEGEECLAAVDRMANFIRSKTWNSYYGAYCASQTASKKAIFHRTVRDFFDNDIRENAEEVAANLLTNIPAWCPTASSRSCFERTMNLAETATSSEQVDTTTPEVKLFNVLFLYTYWNRFLGFDLGGSPETGAQNNANAFLVMAFRGDVIRSGLSILSMTYTVRAYSMLTYTYVDKVSSSVMSNMLGPSTGIYSSTAFTETLVKRLTGYTNVADWFADYMSTIAFYYEYEPPKIEGVSDAGQLIWRGWDQAKRFPDRLLLWLTLPPGSQYFASTSMIMASGPTGIYTTDAEMNDEWRAYFKGRLDAIFNYASVYSATIASIVGVQRPNMFCVLTLDSKVSKFDKGTSWMETEKLTGKVLSQDPFHKGFTDPTCLYISSGNGSAAMTLNLSDTNKRIHFTAYTSLGCNWSYFWSHEMAHAIDNTIFLNGDRRGGNNTEDYTDGLLTQSHGAMSYIMNLSFDYAPAAETLSNLTAERITGKENLNDFYGKLYDTMDVVDYAALQAFLRLDADEQNAVASQAWFSGQNGTSALDSGTTATTLYSRNYILNQYDGTDATTPMNSAAFNDGSRKFETPEEVYDNQVFLRPGISDTAGITWLWANYVSEDLRGVWWFPIHCNGNRPDSRSFKLEMYRMFGDAGYDAWANFGRSGGGDLAKLKQITGYDSFKEWQMAKWSAIEADKAKLSYVSFDDLVNKFEAALKTDASKNDRNLTQMHNLRLRMLYLMKRVTNDFRYGIYDDQAPVVYIRTVEELAAIADNPFGNYALANDIDVTGFDLGERMTLVDAVFYGKLDGQGHKIFSSQNETVPTLFAGAKQAYIKNIGLHGVISRSVATSVVNCELEDVTYALFERYIYTVDDFLSMSNDLKLGLDTFHLMANLDFTEWSAANAAAEGSAKRTAVVTQVMAGTESTPKVFNGNGHTIKGLSGASLFERVAYADIHELTIADSKNTQDTGSGTYAALLAKRTYRSSFSDLYFRNVAVSGCIRVGFVSGDDGIANAASQNTFDGGSSFKRIQVYDGTVTVGNSTTTNLVAYGGFITGRACLSTMEDVYTQGTLNTYGTSCGGLVGALTKAGSYERCISRVDVYRQKPTYKASNQTLPTNVAVFIGEIEEPAFDAENTRIVHCFGLGDPCPNRSSAFITNPAARFTNCSAPNAPATIQQCFESATARYGTTLVGTEGADIGYVRLAAKVWDKSVPGTVDELACLPLLRNNPDFFTSLGFSENEWQFDPTIKLGNPVLRFEGNADTYYDYDMDFSVDFQNEQLCFTGSDFDPEITQVHNLPYKMVGSGGVVAWGGLLFSDNPRKVQFMHPDENNRISITEAIEHEDFTNAEVERKGTRTITLMQRPTQADLYRVDAFETSIEVPPRLENAYADNIKGVRPDSSTALGSIRVLSVSPGLIPALEYRRAAQTPDDESENGAEQATAGEAPWIPIKSSSTPVEPGTYEVRLAATDHSFASYPSTVVVDEFDPESVTFPLTLDPMGGTWNNADAVPHDYNSEHDTTLPTAADISRKGHTFTGWYADAQLTGSPVTSIAAGTTGTVDLHAGWKANTYPVSLELNGGHLANASDAVSEYTYGEGASLPTPTRLGFAFEGWYANAELSGDPIAEISSTDEGEMRLWAKWRSIEYSVTLDAAGGQFAEGVASTLVYTYGTGVALPGADEMTREGCRFAGWFDNAACTGSAVSAISATDAGDKHYWAKWIPRTYDVVLVKNQGTLVEGEHDVTSYTYGTGVVLPQLERAGYDFDGWYPDADFADQPVFAIDAAETGDKQFWAKWTPHTYRITYDLGEDALGQRPPADIDLSAFEVYQSGTAFALPDASIMVWDDHTFAGWYDNPACTGTPITEIAATRHEDLTLYAKWVGNACVLLFHTNGGAIANDVKTIYDFSEDGIEEGAEVTLPAASAITRMGYTFEGWYLDPAFSGDPAEKVQLARGTVSIYAKWSAVEYALSYELNGGSWAEGYVPPQSYTVETQDVVLPTSENLTLNDMAFAGWHGDPSLQDDAIRTIPTGSTGDKTFYAAWKKDVTELPDLKIVSIVLDGMASSTIEWSESGYAHIELPREKMPKSAADFTIEVPEGVYVASIVKHDQFLLSLLLSTFAGQAENESDIWDITLRSLDDPTYSKVYTLEIAPLASSDGDGDGDDNDGDGSGDDGNDGDGDGNNGDGSGDDSNGGNNDGSGDGSNGDGNNAGGDKDDNSNGSDGSGNNGGNTNGGLVGGIGNNGGDAGGNNNAGNGNGSGIGGANSNGNGTTNTGALRLPVTNGSGGSALTATGDSTDKQLIAVLLLLSLLSAVSGVTLLRRRP